MPSQFYTVFTLLALLITVLARATPFDLLKKFATLSDSQQDAITNTLFSPIAFSSISDDGKCMEECYLNFVMYMGKCTKMFPDELLKREGDEDEYEHDAGISDISDGDRQKNYKNIISVSRGCFCANEGFGLMDVCRKCVNDNKISNITVPAESTIKSRCSETDDEKFLAGIQSAKEGSSQSNGASGLVSFSWKIVSSVALMAIAMCLL